jgi:hypothetical protein
MYVSEVPEFPTSNVIVFSAWKATLASNKNTPACSVVLLILLDSQEYVAAMAATDITIISKVASIGETALFDFATANILGAQITWGC